MVHSDKETKVDQQNKHDRETKGNLQDKKIEQTNYTDNLAEIADILEGVYHEANKCRQHRLPNSKCNICEDVRKKSKHIIKKTKLEKIKCACPGECECPLKKEKDQCKRSVIRARHSLGVGKRNNEVKEVEKVETRSKEDWRLRVRKGGEDQEIKLKENPAVNAVNQTEVQQEEKAEKIAEVEQTDQKVESRAETLEVQPEGKAHRNENLAKLVERLIK